MIYRLTVEGDHATVHVNPPDVFTDLGELVGYMQTVGVKRVTVQPRPDRDGQAAVTDELLYKLGFDVLDNESA